MGIGNPVFFFFSVFIAAVILMYFFRKQYRDQVVPSNLLWEEVMKEWQASPWFHRLQKNLLLLLQVLVLFFLMIALVKPYTFNEMAKKDHLVILLDTSASMNALVNNRSHFEEAKEDIQSLIEGTDGKVTLLAVGKSVTTMVSEETNDRVVLNDLKNLPLSNDNEDMKKAIHLGEALAIGSESSIHIFSDSMEKDDFTEELSSPIQVHNLLTNPVNVSLTSFGVERLGSSYKGVAVIENQSEISRRGHLAIYDEKNEIFSVELTLDPGEETVVPLADLSYSPFYKAVIDFNDDYMEDNSLSSIQAASKPAIYVLGEINPFLLKGFQSIGVNVKTIEEDKMKSGDEIILTTKEKWQRLSVEGPAMIVPERSKESTPLTQGIKAMNDDPILKHVDLQKVYVEKVNSIQMKNLQSVVTGDSIPLIQKGEVNGQKLVLLNLHLNESDFPLHPGFPIFLYNSYQFLSENLGFLGYYQPGEERTLPLSGDKWDIYSTEGEFVKEWNGEGVFKAPEAPGVYQAIQNGDTNYFTVELDDREKQISAGSSFSLEPTKGMNNEESKSIPESLTEWFLILAILLLFIEWEVYRRGN
ncbi:vWA domain-containing protein [Rossellomorea aquimaris]|uniref:vWA domain-containing protein n=1 Tax=Rossellomorea aquimaris TaxID=189382 RepID=UPI0005CADFEC|nr:VWA domain-containing protein [Rossellomorea aquimaris]